MICSMKEHIVSLTDDVRIELQSLVRSGTRSARVVRRAQILLKSDAGLIDREIAAHVGLFPSARRICDVEQLPVTNASASSSMLRSNLISTFRTLVAYLSERTVAEVRKRWCQGGWERAVFEAPRPGALAQRLGGAAPATDCLGLQQPARGGRARWTLELLSEKAAEQGFMGSVSQSEVSLWLHGTRSNRGEKKLVVPS